MCGLSALFSQHAFDSSLILGMNQKIRHRGPDDEGYFISSYNRGGCSFSGHDTPREVKEAHGLHEAPREICTAALGHRRLSILDLSPSGHQPMLDEEKRFVVVYNGEIYNFLEIRQDLKSLGVEFKTNSDTEVLIQSWKMWGVSCLSRFNGMFSFVLWDQKNNEAFAVRDRFGVKPLYYTFLSDGTLAFASEIKQFLDLPGFLRQANDQRIYDFLACGLADHTAETMWSGVFQVRGGEFAHFNTRAPQASFLVKRWYEIPTSVELTSLSFDDAAGHFQELFIDSVRLRLRSDVPVGTCLSGGLDSSSVACAIHALRSQSSNVQHSFSACSEINKYDEREFIEKVAKKTQLKSHYVFPDLPTLKDQLQKLVWHHDEPFSSTSVFAEWSVFQLAKMNHIRVTLDGHGADEQLAGYPVFSRALMGDYFSSGRFYDLYKEIRRFAENNKTSLGKSVAGFFKMYFSKYIQNGPAWISSRSTLNSMFPYKKFPEVLPSVLATSIQQIFFRSIPIQLKWADRDSMAHSVESREPFLDYRLVEFVLSLPAEYKLSHGLSKRILRAGLSGLLPDEIRDRRTKLGFVTPEEVWMKNEDPSYFKSMVRESYELSQGFLSREILSEVDDLIDGRRPFHFMPWRIISFGQWLQHFKIKI